MREKSTCAPLTFIVLALTYGCGGEMIGGGTGGSGGSGGTSAPAGSSGGGGLGGSGVCGDWTEDPHETCDDGNTVNETECRYGHAMCTACDATCETVLTLMGNVCGDGIIDAAHETCDDGNTVNETDCQYNHATCTACDATCETLLTLTGNVCGDGVIDAEHETCDDGNVDLESCAYGQTACEVCDGNCEFVDGATSYCGDDLAEGDEVCDGVDLRGETCGSQDFDGGTLTCDESCAAFDASSCTGTGPICGNDIAETGEACDGSDLRSVSCVTTGGPAGDVTCDASCGFEWSACSCVPQLSLCEVVDCLLCEVDTDCCVSVNGWGCVGGLPGFCFQGRCYCPSL